MSSSAHPSAPLPEIQGYRVLRRLGRGGMADVYLAVQSSLQREVALKVLASDVGISDEQKARFAREARTIARLEHPHIVAIFDVGTTKGGQPYYAMPYLPSGDLSKRDLRESPREVLRVLRALAEALEYAHAHGVVHRDVKPENILFDKTERPLLADFGIALSRHETQRVTYQGRTIGSSGYMSPEQARGADLDGRADLYSLGVVAYEMLTGNLPYQGSDSVSMAVAHVQDPIPRLPARWREWQAFIDKALAKSADRRFQSAKEITQWLDAIEQGRAPVPVTQESAAMTPQPTTAAATERSPVPAALPGGPRPWLLALGAAAVAALLISLGARLRAPDARSAPATSSSAIGTSAVSQLPDAERIDALLASGGELLAAGRLVDPADGAAARFLDVLAMVPEMPEARAGLDATVQAAAAAAESAIGARRGADAATLYDQTYAIAERSGIADYPAWAAFERRYAAALQATLAQAAERLDPSAASALEPAIARAATNHPEVAAAARNAATLPDAGARLRDAGGPLLAFVPPSGGDGAFAASVHEVTRGDYQAFAQATGRSPGRCRDSANPIALLSRRDWIDPGFGQQMSEPVVCVTWDDARAYAAWLSQRTAATYRLPTRAEWQRLASATRVGESPCAHGNLLDASTGRSSGRHDCRDGHERTAPVGRYAAGGYGVADLVGNVHEWLADCVRGASDGGCSRRALAGSSYRDGERKPLLPADLARDPDVGAPDVGFRLVRELSGERLPPTAG